METPSTPGRAIFLVGPSSAGKTSLGRELIELLPGGWLFFESDRFGLWHPQRRPELVTVDYEEAVTRGSALAVRGYLDAGINLVVERDFWRPDFRAEAATIFERYETWIVGLRWTRPVLEAREALRADGIFPGTAARQTERADRWDLPYDFVADTVELSPEEAARAVARWFGSVAVDLDRVLDSVLIGGREPRQVEIVDYSPEWAKRFQSERERIAAALGPAARSIEHVGSTAVPGLAAKPIVDILVTVDDADDEAAYVPHLERAGYVLRVREPEHRMLRTPARDVHVHVWTSGSAEEVRHLRFRDRLRAHAGDRAEYERAKRELAGEWRDMNYYARAKGPVIDRILARIDDGPESKPD